MHTLVETDCLSLGLLGKPDHITSSVIDDFSNHLLPALTGHDHEMMATAIALERARRSHSTNLLALKLDQEVVATATVNQLPILSGDGYRTWIDNVATKPDHQGNGYSKSVMQAAETLASGRSGELLLTSSPHRLAARSGYQKRGYRLLNDHSSSEGTFVYRSHDLGKTSQELAEHTATLLGHCYDRDELLGIANILDADPTTLAPNISRALGSLSTAVIVSRNRDGLPNGIGVVNESLVPAGTKPWLDDLNGTKEGTLQVVAEAEMWVASRGGSSLNIMAPFDNILPSSFEERGTGLFVKSL